MLRKSDGFTGDNISADDFNGIYEHICLEPSKVVLIFDGLDELTVDDETLTRVREECVNNNNEETHIFHIWKQLVRGELLPGATILTTSRPTAEKLYKPTIYDPIQYEREVEILGFHEKEVKNYVERFCGIDTQKSTAIWNLIKASPELLSCNVPKTITELYKKAVNILLLRHNLEYKGKQIPPEKLDDLKEIARNGMRREKLIFYDNDVDPGMSNCGLFNKIKDKEQNIYCFLHLTIQEFLAALHVVDDMDNVESFLSEHIENLKWHLVICSLLG